MSAKAGLFFLCTGLILLVITAFTAQPFLTEATAICCILSGTMLLRTTLEQRYSQWGRYIYWLLLSGIIIAAYVRWF